MSTCFSRCPVYTMYKMKRFSCFEFKIWALELCHGIQVSYKIIFNYTMVVVHEQVSCTSASNTKWCTHKPSFAALCLSQFCIRTHFFLFNELADEVEMYVRDEFIDKTKRGHCTNTHTHVHDQFSFSDDLTTADRLTSSLELKSFPDEDSSVWAVDAPVAAVLCFFLNRLGNKCS